jgi:hypothetical protein
MALDFPSSPTNGQVFGNYTYDSTAGAWRSSALYSLGVAVGGSPGQFLTKTGANNYETGWGSVPTSPNYIINGGFDIWQRGTSFSSQGSIAAGYSADRYHFYRDTGNTGATLSRQTSTLQGFSFAARLQRDSGNTSTTGINIRQTLETSNSISFAGQSVTFSFFARAGANYSATSQALNVVLATGTGVDQAVYSFTGYNEIINTSATLTTSWQRFTFTAPVGTSVTEMGFTIKATPTGTAGANDWFEITGVQLEQGSVATSFRRNAPSIQAELAACQRYYWRITAANNYCAFAMGFALETTQVRYLFSPPVTLRTIPSSVEWTGTGSHYLNNSISGGDVTPTNIALTQANSTTSALWVAAICTTVAGRQYQLTNTPTNTSAYLGFSAEL